MTEKYGLWPGVVALVGDADMYCVPCAKRRYGEQAVMGVIDATPGYEQCTDHEDNPLTVVLSTSEDLHGMHCGDCLTCLCGETCWCSQGDVISGEPCSCCGVTTACTCWCGQPLCAECEDRYGTCGSCG